MKVLTHKQNRVLDVSSDLDAIQNSLSGVTGISANTFASEKLLMLSGT